MTRCFPEHGSALNRQGQQLLWLPIVRLAHSAAEVRSKHAQAKAVAPRMGIEIASFVETIRKLCVTLRELHRATYGTRHTSLAVEIDQEEFWTQHLATEMTPIYFDLSIVYLRRCADDLARAVRHSLFAHSESAPASFKELRKLASNPKAIESLGPFCDVDALIRALRDRTQWYIDLTERTSDSEQGRKGIRDALEHKASTLQVSFSGRGDEPMVPRVDIISGERSIQRYGDLLKLLKQTVAEFAEFLTALHASAQFQTAYEAWSVPYGDCMLLFGTDSDSVGFWPAISSAPRSAG